MLGTLLLWVPFFMGFGVLTVVTLWTPALLRLNGISPAATAFVIAFNGFGAFIGQSTAGRLMQRFGILGVLFPAFLLGTAATVGLGYGASSLTLAATFIGLVGLFMGLGTAGAIALSATIYPTTIRSTGIGWGMAMGRFGQIVGPLIAGALLSAGWTASGIMIVIACGGLIAALFIVLFRAWLVRRGNGRNEMAGSSSARSVLSI
jgi:AAHS family 4-hydroxybenzoate transporter-like MFS transporter